MDDLDKGDKYTVRDIGLADEGALLVDWARARMPVLAKLKAEAEQTKPLAGMRRGRLPPRDQRNRSADRSPWRSWSRKSLGQVATHFQPTMVLLHG